MQRNLSPMTEQSSVGVVLALALVSQAAACVPGYRPPTLDQPHATLKLRRTYDQASGTTLHERSFVNGQVLDVAEVPAQLAQAPRIDAALIHPAPSTFAVSSLFFHIEPQQVLESYLDNESYYESSYDCGAGYGVALSDAGCSPPVTRYRNSSPTRWVTKIVQVADGYCQASTRFWPKPEHVYLLQYNYQEHAACSLSCFEQVKSPDGSFRNLPCPSAP